MAVNCFWVNKMNVLKFAPPGVKQRTRHTCCLACALKELGFTLDTLLQVMGRSLSFKVLKQMDDNRLATLFGPLSEYRLTALSATLKSLHDVHGDGSTVNIHRRYKQNECFHVTFRLSHLDLPPVNFQRGQVLEIFQNNDGDNASRTIIRLLEEEFMRTDAKHYEFPELVHDCYDAYILISSVRGFYKVRRPVNQEEIERIYSFDWPSKLVSRQEFKRPLEVILNALNCVSMIIIETVSHDRGDGDNQEVPKVKEWLSLFSRVYGGLDDLFIVFFITTTDFIKFDMTQIGDIKNIVNAGLDAATRSRIICLDVTSSPHAAGLNERPRIIIPSQLSDK